MPSGIDIYIHGIYMYIQIAFWIYIYTMIYHVYTMY